MKQLQEKNCFAQPAQAHQALLPQMIAVMICCIALTAQNVMHTPESVMPGTPDIHDDNAQMFPLDLSVTSASTLTAAPVAPTAPVQDVEMSASPEYRPPTPWQSPIYTLSQSPRSEVSLPDIVRHNTPPASPSSSFELQLQSNEVSSTQDAYTQESYNVTLNTDLTVSI